MRRDSLRAASKIFLASRLQAGRGGGGPYSTDGELGSVEQRKHAMAGLMADRMLLWRPGGAADAAGRGSTHLKGRSLGGSRRPLVTRASTTFRACSTCSLRQANMLGATM